MGTAVATQDPLELRASALPINASGMVSRCGPSAKVGLFRRSGSGPCMPSEVQRRVRMLSAAVLAVGSLSWPAANNLGFSNGRPLLHGFRSGQLESRS